MNLNEYQDDALETDELAIDGKMQEIRLAMGVADEAGEVLGKYKKSLRDSDEVLDREEIIQELGDVLWYVALLSDELEISLDEIAKENLAKLGSRKQRGVIAGSGDHR